jgi:hypothetical protein
LSMHSADLEQLEPDIVLDLSHNSFLWLADYLLAT